VSAVRKAPRRSFQLPAARLTDLAAIRAFVTEAATELGADPSTVPDLVIAVNESVANIIRHGYLGVPGPIEVELERRPGTIVVRLRDEAPPFDPTRVPSPDLTVPLERRRAGGLGVHLTRTCVDAVTHRARPDSGNQLTLVKSLRAQKGGTAG
jgi:serine/threonine-protein kinase RsbW